MTNDKKKITITLYPSNWLYDAGVVGLLRVVEGCQRRIDEWLKEDGSVEGDISHLKKESNLPPLSKLALRWFLESHEALQRLSDSYKERCKKLEKECLHKKRVPPQYMIR